MLFTGPRGVGKTSCARILAKKINQENSKENTDDDFAFNIFELDAASNNSVDDIRNLTDQVRIPPQTGDYKVYIIDEVHMLSQAAFNAFLKTLEEPPKHAIFILATTEKHKIIPTILSRCQIFDFKRISVLDAKNYLKTICEKEDINADDDALHIIAQKADGAMRDALSIFDRVVSFSGKNLTREAVAENLNVLDYETYFNMTDLLLENKIPDVLNAYNSILAKGFEGHHFINGLGSHFRDLLVAKNKETNELLEVGESAKKKYLNQAEKASLNFLMTAIDKTNACDLNYRASKNQRLLVELCLMQIASITFDGEKKKPANYIIPATFFQTLLPKKETVKPQPKVEKSKLETISVDKKVNQPEIEKKIVSLTDQPKRASRFSLKSVHEKKKETSVVEENFDNYPKTDFTEKQLLDLWKTYHQQMIDKGENNMATALGVSKPKLLKNFVIELPLPSKLIEEHFKEGRPKFLKYLRESLNNYGLSVKITIDKTIVKKKAYGNVAKYKLLVEKNPMLEKLRQTFELDL